MDATIKKKNRLWTMQPADPRFRYVYAVWALLETSGFAGVIFGWGSLVYVFKDEGLYSNLCHNGTVNGSTNYEESGLNITVHEEDTPHESARPCPAQDAMLNLVFSVTSSFYCLASFAAGQINLKCGTRVTRLVAMTSYIIGSMAVAFTTNETPWLIFPGTCLVSAAGVVYFITNVQISLLFPRAGSLFIGLLVGGFDLSTGISQAIKFGYEDGISRRTSFLLLGLSQLLTLVSTFLFLPKGFIKKPEDSAHNGAGCLQETIEKSKELKKPESLPPLKGLVFSPTFLLHLYWTAVLQLRFMFVLSSLNVTLERIFHSQHEVSRYTNITAYILMLGIITAPVSGAFCDSQTKRYRGSLSPLRRKLLPFVVPLVIGSTLGVAMSAAILTETAGSVVTVFIILILMRAFIYTVLSGLLLAVFPNEYYGFMFGIIFVVCGAVNLLQNPLFAWATSAGFDQVNILLLVVTASTFVHPLYQWRAVRQEKPVPTGLFTDSDGDTLYNDSETNEYDTMSTPSD